MSARPISEAYGKRLLQDQLEHGCGLGACRCTVTSTNLIILAIFMLLARFASVNEETNWEQLAVENPWLATEVASKLET